MGQPAHHQLQEGDDDGEMALPVGGTHPANPEAQAIRACMHACMHACMQGWMRNN